MVKLDVEDVLDIDFDAWYFVVLSWIIFNFVGVISSILATVLLLSLFNKIISPYIFEYYKEWLGYEKTLKTMKTVLEANYDELWADSDFCLAFLKYHEAYQTFLNEAKLDSAGRTKRVSKFNKFAAIQLQ